MEKQFAEQRIPLVDDFLIYRRSAIALTPDDKPTGVTYEPTPRPSGGGLLGPTVRPTHLIIRNLSSDWQISIHSLPPSAIAGNPADPIWMCRCNATTLGGNVLINPPEKYNDED